jgi:phosphopantothenoylcysteine decarboxylase / phosphopantothenate---cysteine ligase
VVMTAAARQFISPLSAATLSGQAVRDDLFSLTDEAAIGHIELSRAADLIVVAPASANILARMANGLADDMATTVLLATDKRVLAAPAMNVRMWLHPATCRNLERLRDDGVVIVGPDSGPMACGEFGPGRMAEPAAIIEAIETTLAAEAASSPSLQGRPSDSGSLGGRHVIVTSGPTYEPIDPVRFLGNRSSGRQGHAIAQAAVGAGARVTLVTGPVGLSDPTGAEVVHVGSARDMREAVEAALPADAFIAAAAVADWRAENVAHQKIKKNAKESPTLTLVENPDILAEVAKKTIMRPAVVIGFAAETENITANAMAKLQRKSCDLIIANSVAEGSSTFGGETNQVQVIDARGVESWPPMTKAEVADGIVRRLAVELAKRQ